MNEGIIAAVTAIATAVTTIIGKLWFDRRRKEPVVKEVVPTEFWQQEISLLRKELDDLRKDFLEASQKYAYLKSENKSLKERVDYLEKHNAVLEATNDMLKENKK